MLKLNYLKKYLFKIKYNSRSFIKLEKKIISYIESKPKLNTKKGFFKIYEIGKILFPFFSMGKISSINLLNLNEMIIFFFYFCNKKKLMSAADIGANLGLHSIILSKLGYIVHSYEPDPKIFLQLKKNINLNKCKKVKIYNLAVYNKTKQLDFVRVEDNLTGSHIKNLKNSYGKKKMLKVNSVNIKKIVSNYDLIKIDIEGAEALVICSIPKIQFYKTIIVVEIGNKKNAKLIYAYLKKNNLNSYCQKSKFNIIKKFSDFPCSHREGVLFISQFGGLNLFK